MRQNNITKEQLQQFLGAGPATKVDPGDQAYLDKLAEAYKERLKKAGLAADRPGAQYGKGGFTPWLYYQYGAMALATGLMRLAGITLPGNGVRMNCPGWAGSGRVLNGS